MGADSGQTASTGTVEERLMAAVRDGDDTAYYSTLRSARFVMPFHTSSRHLVLDLDGQSHTAVFTSEELANQAVAQYTGGASGWMPVDYSPKQLVSGFSNTDLRLLLNPGTQMQRAFTVPELVERWRAAGHTVTVPRTRRGSLRYGLMALVLAAVGLIAGVQSLGGPVTCGSQVMETDDTCIVMSDGNSFEQTYAQTASSQRRSATIFLVGGGVAAVAGVYMLGARIVTAIPRREKPT